MGGHMILSDKLVNSRRWRLVRSDRSRWVYCILVGAVDSWGMLPANGSRLKAELAPFTDHSTADLTQSVNELARAGLIQVWFHQGDPWLSVTGFEQHQNLRRRKKTPEVPRPDFVLDNSRTTPVQLPEYSGTTPAPLPYKDSSEVEVEVEVEGEEEVLKPHPPPSSSILSIGQVTNHCLESTIIQDKRPGELTPELEEIRHRYAERWHTEPSAVPMPTHDNLARWRQVLTSDMAGPTPGDRIKTAFAAIDGHHREAGKDGSPLGRELRHVVPEARINGRRHSDKVDWDRYLGYARAGRPRRVNHDSGPPPKLAEADRARIEADTEATRELARKAGIKKMDKEALRKIRDEAAQAAKGDCP